MKRIQRVLTLIFVCMFLLMFTCGVSEGGDGGKGEAKSTLEASATIGPAGGTVEVTDSSSPLYGVKIEIPVGALSQETTITINKVVGTQGTIVNIGPSGTIFKIPATVTMPYKDETKEEFLAVVTQEPGETSWTHQPNYIVDTSKNKVVFQVSHLSDYYIGDLFPIAK